MASALNLPIARLRAIGCKVSTVLGHYPDAPGQHRNWHYAITVPRERFEAGAVGGAIGKATLAAIELNTSRPGVAVRVDLNDHRESEINLYAGHRREYDLAPAQWLTDVDVARVLVEIVVHLETHLRGAGA